MTSTRVISRNDEILWIIKLIFGWWIFSVIDRLILHSILFFSYGENLTTSVSFNCQIDKLYLTISFVIIPLIFSLNIPD